MLKEAKALEPIDHAVRIVLLTRQGSQAWQGAIDEAGVDPQSVPLDLAPLSDDPTRAVYWDTRGRLAAHLGTPPPAATTTDFARWREEQGDLGRRPLIVLAATVHAVLHPEAALKIPAAKVVRALERREARRLNAAGSANGFGEGAGAMLAALAAVRGGLDSAALRALAADRVSLEIALPETDKVVAAAGDAGWLRDGVLAEPKPDIMAAVLVHSVLNGDASKAPDRLWAALHDVAGGRLDALARIAYDLLLVEGHEARNRFVGWLVRMIEGRTDRVAALAGAFDIELPALIAPVAVAWGKEARKAGAVDEAAFASLLNNHSVDLAGAGDGAGALDAIREATDIYRRLAKAAPARFEPDLASSLNNLSNRLSGAGDGAGALDAIREATDIYRRLAKAAPARFEPDLALSLNNLSNCLSDAGDGAGALDAIREATDIYRRLAKAAPARFEPELARSHGSLGRALEAGGEIAEARSAYAEGARIIEPHARARPGTPVETLYRRLCTNHDRLGGE
ncbi:MAG: tetratricopeptide repeat protein [Alphaproteobacteria bacterium]|nr:tetratricopeptide repeat protein [Alphaproteobacteria bacterium]